LDELTTKYHILYNPYQENTILDETPRTITIMHPVFSIPTATEEIMHFIKR